MGKRKEQLSKKAPKTPRAEAQPLSAATKAVDPALAALFDSSLVKETKKTASGDSRVSRTASKPPVAENTSQAPAADALASSDVGSGADSPPKVPTNTVQNSIGTNGAHEKITSRKRRRKDEDDDIEGRYMQRLAREEAHEATKQSLDRLSKRSKLDSDVEVEGLPSAAATAENEDQELSISSPPPQHETTTSDSPSSSLEQSTRTVFLGNVSTAAITSRACYTLLIAHLSSPFPSLPESTSPHKISSFRFRSTPYADSSLPKKAAFAKKDLMEATTKSTNAYVVYNTAVAAREAVKKLNGTVVLERHLRVDGVAHPAATDHRRCVFVGNLGFVDDESAIRAAEDEEKGEKKVRKPKQPADVEEGLWRQFGQAGVVESVRVIRDKTTRVGKGFAYVQFKDSNAVERALLYNAQSFPPLLPRTLRVTRAKNIAKTASYGSTLPAKRTPHRNNAGNYTPKPSSQVQSLSGRAGKLLGRAGAAKLRQGGGKVGREIKPPESVVFEGYRARGGQKPTGLQPGKKGKGKPKTRSSKRGAAFKADGGKKKRG